MINRWLRRISVRRRIAGGFLLLLLFSALSGLLLVTNQSFLIDRLQQVTDVENRADRLLLLASGRVESSRINLARYVQNFTPSPYEARDDVEQAIVFLQEAQSISISPDQQADIQLTLTALNDYQSLINDVETIAQESGSDDATRSIFQAYRLGNDIAQRIEQTVSDSEIRVTQANETIFTEAQARLLIFITIFVLMLVLSLFMSWFVGQSITRPVQQLRSGAEAFKQGQLDTVISVGGTDELGMLATAFNDMMTQLRNMVGTLEQRVSARTNDLTLAAEVGRRVSQIRDLDTLLDEAAELIRAHFDLYHTQIYLTDFSGQNLVLHASTGEAGTILRNRGHNLPIGPGSINGMAAFGKEPVIVADTTASTVFQPNPLLPDTRSEMAVPLLLGEQVVGVLDLQSDQPDTLSAENMAAYNSLAGQLAVAVDNARLFVKTAQIQAEVQARTRHLAREGWQEFLDNFSGREQIGFTFDHAGLAPITPEIALSAEHTSAQEIMVAGETIGSIQLESGDEQEWDDDDLGLVNAVAEQVGQRIESLRLLAETNRYRDEAEQAVRRLTYEGWRRYQSDLAQTGFVFDQQEVKPADTTVPPLPDDDTAVTRDLRIQGINIGRLTVTGANETEAAAEMVTAVANQLSAHIENLRLSAQTEEALASTAEQARRLENLNTMTADLGKANAVAEVFTAVTRHLDSIVQHDRLSLALLEPDGKHLQIHALNDDSGMSPAGIVLRADEPVLNRVITQRKLINTSQNLPDNLVEPAAEGAPAQRAALIVPLITARGVLGTIDLGGDAFDAQDENILQQIAPLVASTIENQRLFAETQKQADKERLVNTITQKIQSTVTMESALQTTIQELGQALQARYTQVKLAATEENGKA